MLSRSAVSLGLETCASFHTCNRLKRSNIVIYTRQCLAAPKPSIWPISSLSTTSLLLQPITRNGPPKAEHLTRARSQYPRPACSAKRKLTTALLLRRYASIRPQDQRLRPSSGAERRRGTLEDEEFIYPEHQAAIQAYARQQQEAAEQQYHTFQNTYNRTRLVTWGIIVLFALVYIQTRGHEIGLRSQSPSAPNRVREFQGGKPQLPNLDVWSKIVGGSNINLWTDETWQYRPGDFPPRTLRDAVPYLTSTFAHGSPMHLAVNSYAWYHLSMFLMPQLGIATTLASFVATGVGSSLLSAGLRKAYAQGKWSHYFEYVKSSKNGKDPQPTRTLMTRSLGASGGLCGLATIAFLSQPRSRWSVLFVPVSVPAFMVFGMLVGWDAWAFYDDVQDGIEHGAHLAGYACGSLLWIAALRWGRYGKMTKSMSRFSRY